MELLRTFFFDWSIVDFNTAGDYQISLRAQDNDGAWSEQDTIRLVVDSKPNVNVITPEIPDQNNIRINPRGQIFFQVRDGGDPDTANPNMDDYISKFRIEYEGSYIFTSDFYSWPDTEPSPRTSTNYEVIQDSDGIFEYKPIVPSRQDEFLEMSLKFTSELGDYHVRITPIDTYGLEGDTVDLIVTVSIPPPPPPPPPPPNRAPSINVADQTIAEDSGTTSIGLGQFSSDPDGDALTYTITSQQDTNKVACSISGSNLQLTPAFNFNGQSSCSIKANDGEFDSNIDSFIVNVNHVNVAPEITSFSPTFNSPAIAEVGSQTFSISHQDADVGDSRTVTWTRDGTNIGTGDSVSVSGLTIGSYEIKAIVQDIDGTTDTHTWTLVVRDVPSSTKFIGSILVLRKLN